MIWLIGGPPRIGKSHLAKMLSQKVNLSVISTDAIRSGIKKLNQIPRSDPLFILDTLGEETDTKNFYHNNSVDDIIRYQNIESKEVMKVVNEFIKNNLEYQKQDIIIEGVALLPPLLLEELLSIYSLKYFCVGNSDYTSLLEYSWKYRGEGDWLSHVDKETFSKVIEYCVKFSKFFEKEAKKYSIPYFEIHSAYFAKDIDNFIKTITVLAV